MYFLPSFQGLGLGLKIPKKTAKPLKMVDNFTNDDDTIKNAGKYILVCLTLLR